MSRWAGLLIHQGAIGDFLVALRLTAVWGEYRWWYLGKAALGRLAVALGAIEGFDDIEVGAWHRLFGSDVTGTAALSSFFERFSLVVNVLGGPGATVSRNIDRFCRGRVWHVEPKVPDDFSGHCWRHLVGQVGAGRAGVLPTSGYVPSPACLAAAREVFAEREIDGRQLVLVHPGASGAAKRWAVTNFVAVAERVQSLGPVSAFVIGPVEREQFSRDQIARLREVGPVWDHVPLTTLAGMLHLARGYVGNDNGISHLAGAVGARTVAVFVSTNPARWRPLGPRVWVHRARGGQADASEVGGICERLLGPWRDVAGG